MCRVRPAQPPFFCLENDGPIRFIERTPRQGDGTCQYYDSRYRQEKQEKAEANGFRFFSYSAGTEVPSSVTTIQLSSVVRS